LRASRLPRPPRKARVDGTRTTASEAAAKAALLAAQAGLEKKASAIEIIDIVGKVDYADYLVLMTGSSDRHVAALADAVDELLSKNGVRSISIEGRPAASWCSSISWTSSCTSFSMKPERFDDIDGLLDGCAACRFGHDARAIVKLVVVAAGNYAPEARSVTASTGCAFGDT
jgi:ribosome-associated protein